MKNKIKYGLEARAKILAGFEKVYKTVSVALGPVSGNVAVDKGHETVVLHDGYEIAKSVKISDKYEKVGADILLQAIQKQVDEVGDGTTLITVLARNITKEANKIVAAGVNAMSLRDGLEKLRDEVIEKINKLSIPVKTLDQKIQIATISSANEELGKMVGETLHKIGEDGVSTIEESYSRDTVVEMQEGLQIDQGWRHPLFVTVPEDNTAVLEGARVLVTDMVLSDFQELETFFVKELIPKGKTLFVMAQDFEGNVLPSFVMNKMNGKLNVLCVQAPLFESIQKALLTDIAILTGATMISEDAGIKLKDIKFEHLGYAEGVKSTKDATIITGGKGDKKEIATRIKSIKKQISEEESGFDIAKLEERLARLTGSVAVIKVGGATEVEMKERKERVKDAVEATKTAVRGGLVSGGEITLLNVAKTLTEDDNVQNIVRNALVAPFNKLLSNAGLDSGQMKERLYSDNTPHMVNEGVNVITGEIVDMIGEGIVDPTGVLTSAVYNSINIAIQAISSEAIIPFEEEKK